jgi:RNA polymerase sigma-B factor
VSSAVLDHAPTAPVSAAAVADASRDDTKHLHLRYSRDGDLAAREALVERYQGLVRRLAAHYHSGSDGFDDLLQVANVGLLNALERFEPDRGLAFRSFAVPTILGELRRHFRDTRWAVHMPRGLQERFLLVERAVEQLSGKLGRAPNASDIADKLGLTEEDVLEAFSVRRGYDALSLDRPQQDPDGDEDLSLLDTLGEEEARYDLIAYRDAVAGTVRALPEREQEILRLRFAEDLTQTEIAECLGVSQMQVSRLLRRSLDRLRVVAEASSDA